MCAIVFTNFMTKILITLVLGLGAATVVGVLYFSNLDTSMEGEVVQVTSEEGPMLTLTGGDHIKGKNTIMSLFQMGKSMECTFVFSSNGVRGEGAGFFDNGNARVDSLYRGTTSTPFASYMITDAAKKVMYAWTSIEGQSQGVMMAIPEESSENPNGSTASAMNGQGDVAAVTPETDVEYDCKPWTVDNSVFVPPSDVEFMDMTNMQKQMEDMQKGMGGMMPSGR